MERRERIEIWSFPFHEMTAWQAQRDAKTIVPTSQGGPFLFLYNDFTHIGFLLIDVSVLHPDFITWMRESGGIQHTPENTPDYSKRLSHAQLVVSAVPR